LGLPTTGREGRKLKMDLRDQKEGGERLLSHWGPKKKKNQINPEGGHKRNRIFVNHPPGKTWGLAKRIENRKKKLKKKAAPITKQREVLHDKKKSLVNGKTRFGRGKTRVLGLRKTLRLLRKGARDHHPERKHRVKSARKGKLR